MVVMAMAAVAVRVAEAHPVRGLVFSHFAYPAEEMVVAAAAVVAKVLTEARVAVAVALLLPSIAQDLEMAL